jgi:hypothetical protein
VGFTAAAAALYQGMKGFGHFMAGSYHKQKKTVVVLTGDAALANELVQLLD